MATKTISLELDAYEKLRSAKKAGESFSAVVRRAQFEDRPLRAADLLAYLHSGGGRIGEEYLNSVEKAIAQDPVPDNPWA